MQVVINVPDKIYEMVMNTGTYGCYRFNSTKAIREGVPLDDIKAEVVEYRNAFILANRHDLAAVAENCLMFIDKHKKESEMQDADSN